jgi:sulfhydrogenase subunit beta (sulfur reductase)
MEATARAVRIGDRVVVERVNLDELFRALRAHGFVVLGPTVRDGAIVYDEIEDAASLPEGWTDEQSPGSYRLRRRDDGALFGFAAGPQSPKQFLFPPRSRVTAASRDAAGGFSVPAVGEGEEEPRYAFVGVRACDLAAVLVQDRVFAGGPFVDRAYAARRDRSLVVAVDCGEPSGACFCVSMETGPRVGEGADLVLTELLDGDGHRFVVRIGTESGREIMASVPSRPAGDGDVEAADTVVEGAASRMGRTLDTEGIKELLYRSYEHPQWEDVATRCLACANCTMVCPTCFCSRVEDVTDLSGDNAERVRTWDSCFTTDFSYIHGGSVRRTGTSRYRQWMTHKLATWIDQFGTSGCVGCGRCITWCPVGIDITEEVAAIRASEPPPAEEGPDGRH